MNSPAQWLDGEPAEQPARCEDADTATTLSQALDCLKRYRAAGETPPAAIIAQCLSLDGDTRNAHRMYAQIGEIFIELQLWQAAEQLAIKALKASPHFGAGFKLLGKALAGSGNKEDAALCHRYGLPQSVLSKYFGDVPARWVSSDAPVGQSIRKHTAHAAEIHELPPPKQLGARQHTEFKNTRLHAAEAYTAVLVNSRLWFDGFNCIVWDCYDNLVSDLCRGYAQVVHSSLEGRGPRQLPGRSCLLGNRNANNYYHWMHDVIPRLEVLQASGERLENIDRFICNPLKKQFQYETLRHFGIREDRIVAYPGRQYSQSEELLIPVYGSNSLGLRQGAWNPAFYKREYLRGRLPCRRDLKLYVSRGTQGARGITNDQEVIDFLSGWGFTTLRPEQLSVEEQAGLFARASVVLGPHGAGFANIVFCQPGTTVIELFHAHIHQCFHTISAVSGLEHYIHFCGVYDEHSRPSDDETYHRTIHARRNSPFRVELSELREILEFAGLG